MSQQDNSQTLRPIRNIMCTSCNVACPLKTFNISENKDAECTIPDARVKAILYGLPIMNETILEKMSYDILVQMKQLSENTRDLKMLHDVLTNHKREYYPNIQKQINVNVDVSNTSDLVLKNVFDDIIQQDNKKVFPNEDKPLKRLTAFDDIVE